MEHMQELKIIVREAGSIMRAAELSESAIFRKPGDANFVTAFDVEIQRFLIEKISALFPSASITVKRKTTAPYLRLRLALTKPIPQCPSAPTASLL